MANSALGSCSPSNYSIRRKNTFSIGGACLLCVMSRWSEVGPKWGGGVKVFHRIVLVTICVVFMAQCVCVSVGQRKKMHRPLMIRRSSLLSPAHIIQGESARGTITVSSQSLKSAIVLCRLYCYLGARERQRCGGCQMSWRFPSSRSSVVQLPVG